MEKSDKGWFKDWKMFVVADGSKKTEVECSEQNNEKMGEKRMRKRVGKRAGVKEKK